VGVEQLDAVAVGIAEIDVHGVSGPVPAGAALDLAAEAEGAGHVAGAQQVVGFRRRIGDMVQPRPGAVEEHDVVRVALALEKNPEDGVALGETYSVSRKPACMLRRPAHRHQDLDRGAEPRRRRQMELVSSRGTPVCARTERNAGGIVRCSVRPWGATHACGGARVEAASAVEVLSVSTRRLIRSHASRARHQRVVAYLRLRAVVVPASAHWRQPDHPGMNARLAAIRRSHAWLARCRTAGRTRSAAGS
jgi:hypothetical protein